MKFHFEKEYGDASHVWSRVALNWAPVMKHLNIHDLESRAGLWPSGEPRDNLIPWRYLSDSQDVAYTL